MTQPKEKVRRSTVFTSAIDAAGLAWTLFTHGPTAQKALAAWTAIAKQIVGRDIDDDDGLVDAIEA